MRPQRGLHRVVWPGGGVEFHPSHGDWIRVLSVNGFVVHALHELYAPADAANHDYNDIATAQWARQWPVEDLWAARLSLDQGIGLMGPASGSPHTHEGSTSWHLHTRPRPAVRPGTFVEGA